MFVYVATNVMLLLRFNENLVWPGGKFGEHTHKGNLRKKKGMWSV